MEARMRNSVLNAWKLPLIMLTHGNGFGIAQPFFDGAFYWIDGELYHVTGWFGSQLVSWQWTHPNASETRRLIGREFRPTRSTRRSGLVEVSWSFLRDGDSHNIHDQQLQDFRADIQKLAIYSASSGDRP